MLLISGLFCVLFSMVFPLRADIQSSYAIADVLKYLDPAIKPEKTLIIFDIDNTVISSSVEPGDLLDSPQWLSSMIHRKMEISHLTKKRALEFTLPLHFMLAPYSVMSPVEESVVGLIAVLQQAGYKVIALTARSPYYVKAYTCQGLNKIGIDFSKGRIGNGDYIFNDRVQYVDDILFVAGGHKGDHLLGLLERFEYMPESVVVIDDKDYCIYELEGTLKKNDIKHTCLHYRYCDYAVDTYNIAQSQHTLDTLCARDPQLKAAYEAWLQREVNEKYAYSQPASVEVWLQKEANEKHAYNQASSITHETATGKI